MYSQFSQKICVYIYIYVFNSLSKRTKGSMNEDNQVLLFTFCICVPFITNNISWYRTYYRKTETRLDTRNWHQRLTPETDTIDWHHRLTRKIQLYWHTYLYHLFDSQTLKEIDIHSSFAYKIARHEGTYFTDRHIATDTKDWLEILTREITIYL
jgi:hypothetical protein